MGDHQTNRIRRKDLIATVPDTIAAIATPPGVGGIGILRLSGSTAVSIGEAISQSRIDPGQILFRRFFDVNGDVIDHGLCLCFRAPHSFSGEDCVELQAHGGPIVLDMLLERLCELGARLARPGEFSERAFLNGKIDLTQAEAIADLIESGSRAATRAAMRSLQGQFSDQVHQLLEMVIKLRVYIEGALDFSEEEIDFLDDGAIEQQLTHCLAQLRQVLHQAEQGQKLQEGLSVTLAGLPNAGKSSLLNWLAGYEAAIVTEIAGTTRDVLREHISLRGIPLRLNDTAGLRQSDNPVEREGVRRAWASIRQADLILYLIDATRGCSDEDERLLADLPAKNLQQVFTKSDLKAADNPREPGKLYISCKTGEGMENLIACITGPNSDYNASHQAFIARRRHVDALQRALESVENAQRSFTTTRAGELMAEDMRVAQQRLNEITGEFTNEDLLGKIFSTFCIGK